MKSYTDLEQSKKLAEILPLESADMKYEYSSIEKDEIQEPMIGFHTSSFNWFKESDSFIYFPCWSLAALLNILPDESDIVKGKLDVVDYKYMCTVCIKEEVITVFGNNLLDACYEMIIKLHEQNIL